MQPSNPNHSWKFFRAGGFDQVLLGTGTDLMALDQLDQKLWVALACPTRGLEFDTRTLDLIDTDKDGRVRAPELIAAAKWAGGLLRNPDDLFKESESLPLSAINDTVPEGKAILNSARQILINLGKKDATAISVADATDTVKIFAQTRFNGDSIIIAESAADAATQAVINDIMATHGSVADRSGKPGLDQARGDAFFADAAAFSDWVKKSETDAATVLPLGADTAVASAALKAVKAKIDDYFGRCRLAAFDARALAALNREEKEYLALAAKDMTLTAAEVACFPLATIAPGKPLPLKTGVNPAWADAVAAFHAAVVKPVLGDKPALTEADWALLTGKFAAHDAWVAGKAGAAVEKLGVPRVREILGGKAKEAVADSFAKDKAEEGNATTIAAVEKLVRFHRDLHRLCVNFVSFRDFYDRREPAVFQAGTLYLDQRSCELCLRVEDAGKHASMAALAGTYLAYCDCTRKGSGETMQIVAAFTDGDSENLMVGRNGLFYDRKGRDWDATITKIIDNPISIRQAFWSPYKMFVRMIEDQVARRAAAADAASTAKLQSAAAAPAQADKAKPAEPKKFDLAMVTGITIAATTISGVLLGAVGMILGLKWWQYPLVVLGVVLAISGPAMILAYMKLRKRSLAPILDANGWAVNAKARMNVPFGRSLTQVASLPPGSQRELTDRYAEDHGPRNRWLAVAIILALAALWYLGKLDKLLPGQIKSISVLGTNAPAWTAPTNAPPAEPAK